MENYELLTSAVVSENIPIHKYRSKETGFTVCIANVDGPLVNGYFCLATEAHDDDGLPHTLEHLVFMGSEEYPYKGMLDLFANRCLAQGTNAWTDTDHTCYTMTTAGSEGFLNLLPIYLDHVLYPTLTDSAFITEVHHITDIGEDAGVVYCEMQARENSENSLTCLQFLRAMYPGICGYKSETGGIMKNLRETCNNKKVRDYHASFYRPENLCLIITGNVDPKDVFRVIQPFENKIKSKGQLPPYVRPWMSDVPPLTKLVEERHVTFPTEDESSGSVLMGWRGPPVLEFYEITAIKILFEYLTDTPIAPLQQELVEIEEPLCGDVDYLFYENKETCFVIQADNVPKECIFEIKEKVLEVLQNVANGIIPFDLDRMLTLLHKSMLEEMNKVEDSPHDSLASLAIGDFLYSSSHHQLQEYVDKIKRLEKLKIESSDFWISLLKKYLIGQKMVVIIGDPSEEYMKTTGEAEKRRVQDQAAQLGVKGLKMKQDALNDAIAKNSVEPSAEIVNKLPVPSTDSISFHNILTKSNRSSQVQKQDVVLDRFAIEDFPCAFYVYHVKSLFVQVNILIDTSSLPDELRMYLPLYTEVMFESPIMKDGKLVPYEEVVKQLAADTLQTDACVGIMGGRFSPGSYSSLMAINFKVELDKYETCIMWVKDVLYNLKFTAERLKIVANKIISDVANYKRNGRRVTQALWNDISFTKGCNYFSCNMLRQHEFLTQLTQQLQTSPEKVLSDMERLRGILLTPEHFRFYIAANLESLPKNPHLVWNKILFQDMPKSLGRVKDVSSDSYYMSKQMKAKAVGVGSVESAFLVQTCPGVESYEHEDYPAILVFIEYLCALEGPLWRMIRGCGYSYHYKISSSPATGKMTFVLARSTHVFKAYEVAKQIVEDFISGKSQFEQGQIEAAISGTIFQTIEKEETIDGAVTQNIIAEFKKIPADFNRTLLKKVSQVSVDDLKRVGSRYFSKLFDTRSISVALCCHPTKVDEIVKSFQSIGVEFEVIKSLEDEFLKK